MIIHVRRGTADNPKIPNVMFTFVIYKKFLTIQNIKYTKIKSKDCNYATIINIRTVVMTASIDVLNEHDIMQ